MSEPCCVPDFWATIPKTGDDDADYAAYESACLAWYDSAEGRAWLEWEQRFEGEAERRVAAGEDRGAVERDMEKYKARGSTEDQPSGTLVAERSLNLRQGPSTGSAILVRVAKGDRLAATGVTREGWIQVDYGQRRGWVLGKNLSG